MDTGRPDAPPYSGEPPLIVVDGECVLCTRWAGFILRHDRQARLRLAVTQSPLGRALYAHYRLDPDETNLLVRGGRAYVRSDAVLGVLAVLGPPWSLAPAARVLPRSWRDHAYGWLARNRFRLFGRRDVCLVPDASVAHRFLA